MKKILLIVIIVSSFISCKNKDAEKIVEKKVQVILNKPNEESNDDKNNYKENNEDKLLDSIKTKFSKVYEFKELNDDERTTQWLGITYLEKDCIDFYLYSDTSPCTTEYYGKACVVKNDTINTAAQNNVDKLIFIQEEKEYKLSIILNKKFDQAEIGYIRKDSLETDCLPVDDTVMKLMK